MNSEPSLKKLRVATVSLGGCFGCHMSFLDIDERLFSLAKDLEWDRSPFTDLKTISAPCDIGLIEGGCCNRENVEVLRHFRKHCKVLLSVGQCAITGGLPAMRNGIPLGALFEESYPTDHGGIIPNHEEIPPLLDRVYPCHEVVKIDGFLPGCPPKADLFLEVFDLIRQGRPLSEISKKNIRYD